MLNSASTAPIAPVYGLEELRAIKRRLVSLFERAEIDTVFIENRWKDALRYVDGAIYCAQVGGARRDSSIAELLRFAAAALREIPCDTLNEVTATRYVLRQMADPYYNELAIVSAEMASEDGFTFCRVCGTYQDEGETLSFQWDVWLQNGVLYGEW